MNQRNIVVTGAANGLGKAIADYLSQNSYYRVITTDITGDVDYILDVSSSDAIKVFFNECNAIDVLINSAGIAGPSTSVSDTSDEEWLRTLDVNLNGTFYMCREAIPIMKRKQWGRIVNISSIAGKEGNQNQGAYSASKGAVIALTKSLGKELAETGVLVNAIAPGLINTTIVDDMSPENKARSLSKIPMNRMGEPIEVARLVDWLISDNLSFSTGAVYDISGGRASY